MTWGIQGSPQIQERVQMEDLHTFYTNVVWHFDLTMFYMSKCQTWRLFQERIDSVIYLTFKTDYWSFLSASSPTKWPPEIDSLSVFYLLSVAFLSQKSNTITYPQPKSYWMIDRTLNDQFMAWYYLWPLKYRKRSLVPQVVSHRSVDVYYCACHVSTSHSQTIVFRQYQSVIMF